jgi:phosphinothricin acetyltransferase
VRLRWAYPDDAAAIAGIYAPYVSGSAVSFETEVPDEAEVRRRIEAGGQLHPWIVAQADDAVIGYAYAGTFRPRAAYAHVVETSVYLAADTHGRGYGRHLYAKLIDILVAQGFTQAIAAIALPNEASARLHEALGFVRAGIYRQVGYKLGEWHDVGLWQRTLAPASNPPRELVPFARTDLL